MKRVPCSLLFILLSFAVNASVPQQSHSRRAVYSDSLRVRMYSKGHIIKSSKNPTSNGSLSITTRSSVDLHFYVFDLSGTLVHRATLKDREKSKLPALEKGTYLYDVFQDDLSIEEGKIVIK
ncbi:MAG: T9SS type A sorting domain-containing protein [Chitinophagaceae bacterium]